MRFTTGVVANWGKTLPNGVFKSFFRPARSSSTCYRSGAVALGKWSRWFVDYRGFLCAIGLVIIEKVASA